MPADSFVRIWKFVARPNLCGTLACRQAAGRWAQAGDTVQVFSGDFDSVCFDSFAKLSADFWFRSF